MRCAFADEALEILPSARPFRTQKKKHKMPKSAPTSPTPPSTSKLFQTLAKR